MMRKENNQTLSASQLSKKMALSWCQFLFLAVATFLAGCTNAFSETTAGEEREVVVSHTDEKGILQIYRKKEDGSGSVQLTNSEGGCRMPAVSPDGKRLVYVEAEKGSLALKLCNIDGENARTLVEDGMNLLPSWVPDGRHVVWMKTSQGKKAADPAINSQIHLIDTETGGSRRLFTDPDVLRFNEAMPSLSPDGRQVAFVSNRSGSFRVWVSDFDGSNPRMISKPPAEEDPDLQLPIEQKVPAWSPDGKWIAHWEGVEMIHMSPFTGVKNPEHDRKISATFHVWVVSVDEGSRRKAGRGDDPTWSPDGFVTRAFPDPERGGPKVMVETQSAEKELPIVPPHRNWGRFAWLPMVETPNRLVK